MTRHWYAILALALQTACSGPPDRQQMASSDVAAPAAEAAPPAAPAASGPQIAYSYRFGYRLSDDAIAPAQARAVALCTRLGTRRCMVAASDLTGDPDTGGSASLSLLIDARLATTFGRQLDTIAIDAGGSGVERHVEAEDVTKQIVDTAARVRAKQALADRLLTIIRTADGKVSGLIEAEKSYGAVQEELDAARSIQAALRQRVAMSRIDINYTSIRASGAWAPVGQARRALVGNFASSIAALVTFVAVAIPWVLLLAFLVWIVRRTGWRPRWPFRRRRADTPAPIA